MASTERTGERMANRTTSSTRKPVGKRTRFEVFKRDGFTCQYCGRRPPDVTLHCDHITPVAKGGSNDPVNLITACKDCNAGKSAVELDDVRPSPDAEVMRLELEQQLAEVRLYHETVSTLDAELTRAIDGLGDLWMESFRTSYAPINDIDKWVHTYGPTEVSVAVSIAGPRMDIYKDGISTDRRRYVGAILRNRKNESEGRTCATCASARNATARGTDEPCIGCLERPLNGGFAIVYPKMSCRDWSPRGDV